MSERLGDPIRVRLKLTQQAEYEALAAQRGQTLGPYLRDRLESDDLVLHELAEIRHLLEEMADQRQPPAMNVKSAPAPGPSTDMAMMVEILLLLRSANPGKTRAAQAEIERMGLKVWVGEEG